MSDITRELRNRIEEVYGGHGTVQEFPDDLCHRAADEIDRLRQRADALAEALRCAARAFDYHDDHLAEGFVRGALAAYDAEAK